VETKNKKTMGSFVHAVSMDIGIVKVNMFLYPNFFIVGKNVMGLYITRMI
jgi:hypothetical protein